MMYNYSTPSGLKLATSQITTIGGSLQGIDLMPPLAGYAILTVYDSNNADTNALIVSQLYVDAGTVGLNHEYFVPVALNRGLYCVLEHFGGTGSKYFVRFSIG